MGSGTEVGGGGFGFFVGTGFPGGSATCGTSGFPVCGGGGFGLTWDVDDEEGGGFEVCVVLVIVFERGFIGGDFFGGGSLLFNLEGFSSPDESDELELELELEESDFGVSGICDGWGCAGCKLLFTGGIASSSGSALVPVDTARSNGA